MMKQFSVKIKLLLFGIFCTGYFLNNATAQCNCNSNRVVNGSFEQSLNNWAAYNGTLNEASTHAQCGSIRIAQFNYLSGSSAGFSQDIFSIRSGEYISFNFWAAVSVSSFDAQFGLAFYNGANLIRANNLQIDHIKGTGATGMRNYQFRDIVPSGTTRIRVFGVTNGGSLYLDEICLSVVACNPNDNSASNGFCASNLACEAGAYYWSQVINPNDGSATNILSCTGLRSFKLPKPYTPMFGGAVEVQSINYVSYDGYNGRSSVSQANERWRLRFEKAGKVVGYSHYSTDVADNLNQSSRTGNLGSLVLAHGADEIFVEHWSVANDINCQHGNNNVILASICIVAQPTNPCKNFMALAQSDLNLVKTRTISNEIANCGKGNPRVMFMDCLLDRTPGGTFGARKNWHIISGGTLKEYCDGTAQFNMVIQNAVVPTYQFEVSVILTGRSYNAPLGNPHLEGCTIRPESDWYYYNDLRGTMKGLNDLEGAQLSLKSVGASFQLGTNAALFGASGLFGASAWLEPTILVQPNNLQLEKPCLTSEFYFYLTGGALPSREASQCNKVCIGTPVQINSSGIGGRTNYSYEWNNFSTNNSLYVNPSSTSNYIVTVTDENDCTASDIVTIQVGTTVNVSFTGDTHICKGESTTITVSATSGGQGIVSYDWGSLGTGASQSLNPNVTTTYVVTVTDQIGCTGTGSIEIIVSNSPIANATNNGPLTCNLTSVTVSTAALASGAYQWNTGASTRTFTTSISGTYTVTITDLSSQCSSIATTYVDDIRSNVNSSIAKSNDITCTNSSANLSVIAAPNQTYQWSNGGINFMTNVSQGGTYTVTVTNINNGCTSSSSIVVSENKSLPTSSIQQDGPLTCSKNEVNLQVTQGAGNNYIWSNGLTSNSIAVNSAGTYTITVTNTNNGCTSSSEVVVTENKSTPSINLSHNGPITCIKEQVTINATSNSQVNYLWSNNQTTSSIVVNSTGTYSVTITDINNGCTNWAQTIIEGRKENSLGNYVWEDTNGNGIQDLGEPGINDVLLTLLDDQGNILAFERTRNNKGVDGYYGFNNLKLGTYSIFVTLPNGYSVTQQFSSLGNETNDNDADELGEINDIIVDQCEENNSIDIGLYRPASLGNFVWEDLNANGRQDPGEPGLNDVEVVLKDGQGNILNSTRTTNSNGIDGFYSFTDLAPGDYKVMFMNFDRYYLTKSNSALAADQNDSDADSNTGNSSVITLVSGENNPTIDAGYYRLASLGNFIWLDTMNQITNGVYENGEIGVNNIKLALMDEAGTVLSTTFTTNSPVNGQSGYYQFSNLVPGRYKIMFMMTPQEGYVLTTYKSLSTSDTNDSDFDPNSNMTEPIDLVSGESNQNLDAGLIYSLLPLEWLSFTAKNMLEYNQLQWSTADEKNTSKFIIERKTPTATRFTTVDQVMSNNIPHVISQYSFDDLNIQESGRYLYRIKQIDLDGSYSYSKVAAVNVLNSNSLQLKVYPNPVVDNLNLEFKLQNSESVEFRIFNHLGKNVYTESSLNLMKAGSHYKIIPIVQLAQGTYYLEVKLSTQTIISKFVIVK